ncbi:TRAP transporter substrate-binding protein [Chloroflexota bacterium]
MPERSAWQAAVKDITDGRIVIDLYPGQSLIKREAADDAVTRGVCDIANISRVFGQIPLFDVMVLPAVHPESGIANNMVYWFKMHQHLDKYFAEVNQIMLSTFSYGSAGTTIWTARKPVRTFDDLKGLTLASTSRSVINMFEECGVIVIPITSTQAYDAFAKGIADGGAWNWEGPWLFGWIETGKPGYYIDVGGVVAACVTEGAMNRQKYESLPQDLRETFDQLTWFWTGVQRSAHIDAVDPLFQKRSEERGLEYIVWSDEDKAKFRQIKEDAVAIWIEDMEKMHKLGAEATELVKIYHEALDEYVPPAPVPVEPEIDGDPAVWNAIYGTGSTWGMDYKAYPNQVSKVGLHQLEGDVFKPWK